MVVLGRTIEGITNVKYSRNYAKERQYGRGNKTQNILTGNEEIGGEITLLQSELRAINLAIRTVNPRLNIGNTSFDMIVNFENDEGLAQTDSIVGVNVEGYEKGMEQGDTHMKITLPFMAVDLLEDI